MSRSKRLSRRTADAKRMSNFALESLEPRSMLSATILDTECDSAAAVGIVPAAAETRSAPAGAPSSAVTRNTVTRGAPVGSSPQIAVTGPDAAVLKGTDAIFVISLSKAASAPVTVNYTTVNGGAAAGTDYRATSGTLVFRPGELTKEVAVAVLATAKDYSPKVSTFSLELSSATNAKLVADRATATINNKQAVDWTVLVYMTGDNLNSFAQQDINEMEIALGKFPAKTVNIAVSLDQPADGSGLPFATGNGRQSPWKTYGRSLLTPDLNPRVVGSTFEVSPAEKDTGDPRTLVDFVRWGMAQAPARHYALQIWGHGGGLLGSQFDSDNDDDALEIAEISDALKATGMPKFDVISYDNCLMNMLEVGAALAPALTDTGVYVASEDLIPGTGQDYRTAYSALQNSPALVTPTQLGNGMVASYGNQYSNRQRWDTFSTIAGASYVGLTSAMSQFVTTTLNLGDAERKLLLADAQAAPGYEQASSRDLGRFMATVAANAGLPGAVRSAANTVAVTVASAVQSKTADAARSTGISVYLPTSDKDSFLSTYSTQAAGFVQATQWNSFANWVATGSRSLPSGASSTIHNGAISVQGSRAVSADLAAGATVSIVTATPTVSQPATPLAAPAATPVASPTAGSVVAVGASPVEAARARAFATFTAAVSTSGDEAAPAGGRAKIGSVIVARLG